MCLLLVGVTLRMAPLIDDMGESNIHYLLKILSLPSIDVEANTQHDECSTMTTYVDQLSTIHILYFYI